MKYKYSSFKLLPCGVHVSSLTAIDDDDDDATQSVVGMMIGIPLDTVLYLRGTCFVRMVMGSGAIMEYTASANDSRFMLLSSPPYFSAIPVVPCGRAVTTTSIPNRQYDGIDVGLEMHDIRPVHIESSCRPKFSHFSGIEIGCVIEVLSVDGALTSAFRTKRYLLETPSDAHVSIHGCCAYAVSPSSSINVVPKPLIVPPSWSNVLNDMCTRDDTVVMICGPKNTGKSTFSRLLCNRWCNKSSVIYFDTDVGQPENVPPGLIAMSTITSPILSPPPCRLRYPEHCVCYGASSCRDNHVHYNNCIASLTLPQRNHVIINTHGWVKGLGADVLTYLAQCHHPTDIVVMETGSSKDLDLDPILSELTYAVRVHRIKADTHGVHSVAKEIRYNELELALAPGPAPRPNPQRVKWSNVVFLRYLGPMVPTHVLVSVNGCVVGLGIWNVPLDGITIVDGAVRYGTPAVPPACPPSEISSPVIPCIGLGLVSAIDIISKELYIISPVSLPEHVVIILCSYDYSPDQLWSIAPYKHDTMITSFVSGNSARRSQSHLKRRRLDG